MSVASFRMKGELGYRAVSVIFLDQKADFIINLPLTTLHLTPSNGLPTYPEAHLKWKQTACWSKKFLSRSKKEAGSSARSDTSVKCCSLRECCWPREKDLETRTIKLLHYFIQQVHTSTSSTSLVVTAAKNHRLPAFGLFLFEQYF